MPIGVLPIELRLETSMGNMDADNEAEEGYSVTGSKQLQVGGSPGLRGASGSSVHGRISFRPPHQQSAIGHGEASSSFPWLFKMPSLLYSSFTLSVKVLSLMVCPLGISGFVFRAEHNILMHPFHMMPSMSPGSGTLA
jgi:hypothetical protein